MKQNTSLSNSENVAKTVRRSIIEMAIPAVSHHIGCSLGIVDILVALYGSAMNIFPQHPTNPQRDIFILSKGHGAAALYATLCAYGYFDKTLLHTYDRDGSSMPEHASTQVPGVELSTGSLGHGLSVGLGFAVSFLQAQKPNKVYVLLSDGELNEGSNWEAIQFAGHHKLHNTIALIDSNDFQGYASTHTVLDLHSVSQKFEAFGWETQTVDGHDIPALISALTPSKQHKPLCIIAKTLKGKGVSMMEGKFESHYKSLSDEDKKIIQEELA